MEGIHAVSGYAVHKLPVPRSPATGGSCASRFEQDGRLYERRLRIKRWKDRLPEAGALFAGGVSKRRLLPPWAARAAPRRDPPGRTRPLAGGRGRPLFVLWNPPGVAAVMVAYGSA